MKTCLHLSRLATAGALGAAFTASNGPAVGVTLGVAVAAALYVARAKAC